MLTNGLTTTTTFWKYLAPQWSKHHRVIMWDMPGHGESSPAASTQSAALAEQADILAAVMEAAQLQQAVQVGWSTGCQVVLEFYRRYPARCRGLALLFGSAGEVLSTAQLPLPGQAIDFLVRTTPKPLFAAIAKLMAHLAGAPLGQVLPRKLGLIGQGTNYADASEITEHLTHIHPATVQTMIASAQAHNAWDMLQSIAVPTLVITGDLDPFAPAATVGVPMSERIPGATLLRLPDATHTALLDHPREINAAVEAFLNKLQC